MYKFNNNIDWIQLIVVVCCLIALAGCKAGLKIIVCGKRGSSLQCMVITHYVRQLS